MTNDELQLLQQGRIPAEVVLPHVLERLAIRERSRGPEEPGALILLCERQGLEYHTVARALYRFQHPEQDGPIRSLDFDMADKLLCGVHLYDLWHTHLAEYYKAVDLSWKKCECDGCETWFQIKTDTIGRQVMQKYCSRQCRQSAYKLRKGRTHKRLPRTHRAWAGTDRKCRHGHPRTPENTVLRKNGKFECLICKRASNRASHARGRAALQVAA